MKIEDEIKSSISLKVSTKIVLNVLHTQNLINEKFNIVLKPYEHQGSNIMSYGY
jgi:hypothetical protein